MSGEDLFTCGVGVGSLIQTVDGGRTMGTINWDSILHAKRVPLLMISLLKLTQGVPAVLLTGCWMKTSKVIIASAVSVYKKMTWTRSTIAQPLP